MELFGMTIMKFLDMCECGDLEELPLESTNLSTLEKLDFSKYESFRKILEGFGGLTHLKKLSMWEYEA